MNTKTESEKRQTAVIKDISDGLSKDEIYTKYQISRSTLHFICNKYGISLPKSAVQKRNELIEQDLWNNMSTQDILKKYNLKKYNFYQICRKNNFELPYNRSIRMKLSTFSIIADLFNLDLTFDVIAEKHGLTRQRVGQIYLAAKEAKIPGLPIRS